MEIWSDDLSLVCCVTGVFLSILVIPRANGCGRSVFLGSVYQYSLRHVREGGRTQDGLRPLRGGEGSSSAEQADREELEGGWHAGGQRHKAAAAG